MTTSSTAIETAANAWGEGIVVIPGPTDGSGDGTHETDLSGYYSADYAVIGVVGMVVVVAAAFVIAMRRRLRAHRRKR